MRSDLGRSTPPWASISALVALLVVAAQARPAGALSLSLSSTEAPYAGVTLKQYRTSSPTTDVWVAEVDLCAANIHVDATRAPSSTVSTGAWAADWGVPLALNGDFYKTGPVRVRYAEKKERAAIRDALLEIGLTEKEGAKGNPAPGAFQLRLAGGFPGFGTRYCTSEFKTAEVSKWTTAFVKQHLKALGRPARVLNVLGLRAYESENRAGKGFDVKGDDTQARQTREWLPIQTLPESAVWDLIKAGGLPYHPIYDLGFQRLSCRLCPLAGDEDVALAALTYPELTKQITDMEDRYGFKFKEKYGLREVIQRALAKAPGLSSVAKIARQSLGRR